MIFEIYVILNMRQLESKPINLKIGYDQPITSMPISNKFEILVILKHDTHDP